MSMCPNGKHTRRSAHESEAAPVHGQRTDQPPLATRGAPTAPLHLDGESRLLEGAENRVEGGALFRGDPTAVREIATGDRGRGRVVEVGARRALELFLAFLVQSPTFY